MTTSVKSRTNDSPVILEISQAVREIVAAMPIVIFANAIAAAIKGSRQRTAISQPFRR